MKFLKSTIVTFFTNVFSFGISFITMVIVSRALGPDGKGIISVSNNVISFMVILLGFGIDAANIFFIGRNRRDIRSILGVNLGISIFSIFVVSILYAVNLRFDIQFLKGLDSRTLIITLITIPILNLKSAFMNVLLGIQEVIEYNKITVIDRLVTFGLLVTFIVWLKTPYWLIFSNLISVAIMLLILSVILFIEKGYRVSFRREMLKDMMKYGVKNQVGNIVQLINYRLDVFIINYYLPVAQVGIYSNAVSLGETMWQVSGSVATVVYPMTTNSENKLDMKDFINKTTRITFYIVLVCAIGLILISKPLILLVLGKDFIGSATALVYLIPGISVFSISKILANYIAGIGLVEKNIIASTVSGVVTILLDVLLIPRIGIVGASLASSISYIVFTFITIGFYVRITGSRVGDLVVLKREDIADIKRMASSFMGRFKRR